MKMFKNNLFSPLRTSKMKEVITLFESQTQTERLEEQQRKNKLNPMKGAPTQLDNSLPRGVRRLLPIQSADFP